MDGSSYVTAATAERPPGCLENGDGSEVSWFGGDGKGVNTRL